MSEDIVQTEALIEGTEKEEVQKEYELVEQVNAKIEEEVKTEDVEQGTEIKESVVTEEKDATPDKESPPEKEVQEDRKRAPEAESGPRKERRNGIVLKILCPFYSVGSVIGKGGERISEMKEKTGAAITISKFDSRFPGTKERVISIQSDCEEIKEIVKFVQLRIREDKPPPSAKAIDVEGNEKRKQMCKLVVADGVLGKIIGKGGETIKELKDKHGVNIKTSNKADFPFEFGERLVSVEGEIENIEACCDEIIESVFEDSRSNLTYFTDYASLGKATGGFGGGGYRGGDQYGGRSGGYDNRGYQGGYDRVHNDRGYGGGYGGRGGGRRY